MDSFHDLVSLIAESAGIALVITLVPTAPYFLILRAIPALSRFRQDSTWRSDLKPIGFTAGILFTLVLSFFVLAGGALSDMCGTGNVTQVVAPDGRHKIVVYNFDCGATTDFSLDVSLLNGSQSLPRHSTAALLYSHYHQQPIESGDAKNFQVDWLDPTHVVVHVARFDGPPQTKHQDGIQIDLQPFP